MKRLKYFMDCQTAEELKSAYHKLVKKLHPDNGGDAKEFVTMKSEFESLFNILKNTHYNSKTGETWEATGDRATTETAKEFMDIIEKLMFISALNVELCGSWIWVSGDTKSYKELLKELDFKYSSNKQMWYYQRDGKRRFHKKAWSINQIRDVYGSEKYRGERDQLETATA